MSEREPSGYRTRHMDGYLVSGGCYSRLAAPGDYKILGEMPERDGDRMYRIKSPLEEHERVVGESLLVRSEGHLPDGAMAQRSRRGSITLPKLRIALRIDADDEPDGWSVVSVPGH